MKGGNIQSLNFLLLWFSDTKVILIHPISSCAFIIKKKIQKGILLARAAEKSRSVILKAALIFQVFLESCCPYMRMQ